MDRSEGLLNSNCGQLVRDQKGVMNISADVRMCDNHQGLDSLDTLVLFTLWKLDTTLEKEGHLAMTKIKFLLPELCENLE